MPGPRLPLVLRTHGQVHLLLLGLLAHGLFQLRPAWERVNDTPSARDFASYYYAVKVAAEGGDPYQTQALGRLARAEKTRNTVQPYFYPPPFLFTVAWALPLPLHRASYWMLALNELALAGCLWALRRWYGVALGALGLVLATYSPIPDNAWMGQANLIVLFPSLLGLAVAGRRPVLGGVLVGAAAMFKMSPALFLLYWVLRGNIRAVLAAGATAVGLTVLSLPLVDWDTQVRFYTEVLPGFARGDYHDLTVALALPANHSVPDLFNRAWPGDTPTSMSAAAITWSRAANLALLGAWGVVFWRRCPREAGGRPDAYALGALTLLMTIAPAYTYEHHLVFLLLPVTVLATAAFTRAPNATRRRYAAGITLFVILWFFLAWPLDWLNVARKAWPAGEGLVRESKFISILAIWAGLLALGWRERRSG